MTNTITYDGVEYRKVKRKAEVGEKVLITNGYGWYDVKVGEVYNVIDGANYGFDEDGYTYVDYAPSETKMSFVVESDYLVLEPIESASVEASPSVIELLSNLALRLTKVEAELKPKEANEVNNVTTTQSERIESVCNEVRDLLIRKNHDYGDSFSKQYAKYGVMSGLIRMDDKIRRLETLVGGEEAQVSESIEDTIADLAGYALLTLVELRKTTE